MIPALPAMFSKLGGQGGSSRHCYRHPSTGKSRPRHLRAVGAGGENRSTDLNNANF